MARKPKYKMFTPPLGEGETFEPARPGEPEPVPPAEMLDAVTRMGSEELVDRLLQASEAGECREFELLLRAAQIHEKAEEGTFTNEIWMLHNCYGAPAGREKQTRAGALGEIRYWRKGII